MEIIKDIAVGICAIIAWIGGMALFVGFLAFLAGRALCRFRKTRVIAWCLTVLGLAGMAGYAIRH
jgi:hypothetical protein